MDTDFKRYVETIWREVISDELFHFHASLETSQGIHLFYFNKLFQLRFSNDYDPNNRMIMANVTVASLKTPCNSEDWWHPCNRSRNPLHWWNTGTFGIGAKDIQFKTNLLELEKKMFGSIVFFDITQTLEWRLALYKLDRENMYEFYRTHTS